MSIVEIFFPEKELCTIPTTIVLDSFLNMHYHVVTYSDCYLFLYVTIHSLWLATSMQFILLSGMMEIHPSDASRLSYKCMDRCCYVYLIPSSPSGYPQGLDYFTYMAIATCNIDVLYVTVYYIAMTFAFTLSDFFIVLAVSGLHTSIYTSFKVF